MVTAKTAFGGILHVEHVFFDRIGRLRSFCTLRIQICFYPADIQQEMLPQYLYLMQLDQLIEVQRAVVDHRDENGSADESEQASNAHSYNNLFFHVEWGRFRLPG